MAPRGSRLAVVLAAVCLVVTAPWLWIMRPSVLETWYIHKIETARNEKEAEEYAGKLRAIASPRTMPRLMRLLRDRRKDVLDEDGKLKDLFFNTVAAIGPEGVAAVLRGVDEETLEKVRDPLYWADGGREALLGALRQPDPIVRRRSIGCQSASVRIYRAVQNGFAFTQTSDNEDEEMLQAILSLIDDSDRAVRAAAAARLAKPFHGNRLVRREIRSSLSDPEVRIRRETAEALDFDGARMALRELIAALKDSDLGVRLASVRALGHSGSTEAVGALAEVIADPALEDSAMRAIQELTYSPNVPRPSFDDAVVAILRALEGGDSTAGEAVIAGLGAMGPQPDGWGKDAVTRLFAKAGTHREAVVRFLLGLPPKALPEVTFLIEILPEVEPVDVFAAWALSSHGVGAAPAVPHLIATMKQYARAAWYAIHAIGKLAPSSPEARKALLLILKGESEWRREPAARALESSAQVPEVFAALVGIVEDPKTPPRLLGAAASALARAGPALRDHLPKLLEILEKTSHRPLEDSQFSGINREIRDIEDGLIAALAGLGPAATEAQPFLKKTLPKKFRYARAVLAIEPEETPEVVQILMDAVRNGDATWNDCAEIFQEIGPAALPAAPFLVNGLAYSEIFERALLSIGPEVVPELIKALAGDDMVLRGRAANVLGQMGPAAAAAIPVLQGLLKDPDDEVFREAVKALKRIRVDENPSGK